MKSQDFWKKFDSEHSQLIFNLWDRWQDEKEYEDIQDYLKSVQESVPEAYAITKRPFGVKCKTDDCNVHITVKINKGYARLHCERAK